MINYDKLPVHCRAGMRRYIEDGCLPGSFLRAVICNDLVGAFVRADDGNTLYMRAYTQFLQHEAPHGAWGSLKNMEAWNQRGGLNGIEISEKEGG